MYIASVHDAKRIQNKWLPDEVRFSLNIVLVQNKKVIVRDKFRLTYRSSLQFQKKECKIIRTYIIKIVSLASKIVLG